MSCAGMELGHWVTGLIGHLGHLSRPGHRVIILTRCETGFFQQQEKSLESTEQDCTAGRLKHKYC